MSEPLPPGYGELTEAEISESAAAVIATLAPGADMWVFAYGSLMWHPGFAYAERCEAQLYGFHRAFCIISHHYRGSYERPGLVLGLDRGGSCRGIVYRVPRRAIEATVHYLWRRELITRVYAPRRLAAHSDAGRLSAHTFVLDRAHPQYAGRLSLDETAALIRQGVGESGACLDYLANTVAHLDQLGITDGPLHGLLERVQRLA